MTCFLFTNHDKLIRKASDVVRVEFDSLMAASTEELSELQAILGNVSHPLHNTLVKHRSTCCRKLITLKYSTECHRKSFLLVATGLHNSCLTVWPQLYVLFLHNTLMWNIIFTQMLVSYYFYILFFYAFIINVEDIFPLVINKVLFFLIEKCCLLSFVWLVAILDFEVWDGKKGTNFSRWKSYLQVDILLIFTN